MGKLDNRAAYKEWSEYYNALKKDKASDDLTPVERLRKREQLEKDKIAWIQFFFSEYCSYPFAPFHRRAIKRLTENMEWYEVLSWSRELAKSTIVMFVIMYLVLTGRKRNVLIVSNSHTNAERLLRPYKNAFEKNQLLKDYYGNLREFGKWTSDEFSLTTGATFRALGAGESPRGTREDANRPDAIIVDDYDTDEDCRNPDIVKQKWDWFENALFPTRSVSEDLLVVFCGNVIANNCCVVNASKKADNWEVINIRDAKGKSTWPEKNSEERIRRIEMKVSTKAFQQEYMNNPLSEGDVFKQMVYGECPPLKRLQFAIAYGDPAPSNSKNKASSFKALWLIGYLEGKFYVYYGFLDHVTNEEFVEWYYSIRDYVDGRTQVYSYIENNKLQDPFYEQVFMPMFAKKGQEKGFVGIIPDERCKPPKFERIEGNLEPLVRQGRLVFNIAERENPHMKRLEEQFMLVNRAMKSPADGPDCIEGGVYIANQKIATMATGAIVIGARTRNNSKRY